MSILYSKTNKAGFRLRFLLLIFLTVGAYGAEETADLYEKGKTLYFQHGCNNCHGSRAEGTGNYPLLANRAKGFLAYKLETFRKGIAETPMQEMMIGFASALSDDDIDAITTFLNQFRDEQTERYDPGFQTWGDGGS